MYFVEEKKNPVRRGRCGRFNVTEWKKQKVLSAKHDCDAEREITIHRFCVQYSRYNHEKRDWEYQRIWCNPEEIRDLMNAIDRLNGSDTESSSVPERSAGSSMAKNKVSGGADDPEGARKRVEIKRELRRLKVADWNNDDATPKLEALLISARS